MVAAIAVTILVGGAVAASWKSIRRRTVQVAAPPTIDSEGVDPAIVRAIDSATQHVTTAPRDPEGWGVLGMTFHAHEFNEPAGVCYDQAAALDPSDVRWPYYRAKTVALLAPKEAVEHLGEAVRLCDNNPVGPRLSRIELLLELLELDEAETELATFLSYDSTNARARLAKGRLLFMRGEYQASLTELRNLDDDLTAGKSFVGQRQSLHLLIAESLRRLGRIEESEAVRKKAMPQSDFRWSDELMDEISDHKTGLKTYLVQADLLFGSGQYQTSIDLLRRTIQQYPDSLWGRILLARALIRTGSPNSSLPASEKRKRLTEAEQQLNQALEQDENSVEAMFRLAVLKTYQGDLATATQLYRQAIDRKPDFTMAHYNLASCLNRQGDKKGAVNALKASIESQPDFVDGHHMLGRFLVNDREYAEAERHLEIAAKLKPNDRNIAKFYIKTREMREILSD